MATVRNNAAGDDPEGDKIRAISQMPANLAVLKMENDAIQAMAVAHPRNMAQIKADLTDILTEFPVLAEQAVYSKPVGKVVECRCNGCKRNFEAAVKWNDRSNYVCPKCGEDKGIEVLSKPRQKFARGLSIRAAETLREAYGFNRVRADVNPIDENTVKIEATFVDYQRGTLTQLPVIVSRLYKGRGNVMQTIPEDRFYENTVKGAVSKAIREVVVRSVNPGMRLWFEDECEKIQATMLNDEKIDAIIAAFIEFKLDIEQIEEILGKPRKHGWTTEDRKRLVGIYNGLKAGDLSVSELFADEEKPPAGGGGGTSGSAPSGPVTGASLTSGKATAGSKPGNGGLPPQGGGKKPTGYDAFAGLSQGITEAKTAAQLRDIADRIDRSLSDGDITQDQAEELQRFAGQRNERLANSNAMSLDQLLGAIESSPSAAGIDHVVSKMMPQSIEAGAITEDGAQKVRNQAEIRRAVLVGESKKKK